MAAAQIPPEDGGAPLPRAQAPPAFMAGASTPHHLSMRTPMHVSATPMHPWVRPFPPLLHTRDKLGSCLAQHPSLAHSYAHALHVSATPLPPWVRPAPPAALLCCSSN